MTLKENLPSFIAEEKFTSEILDAIQPEIDNVIIRLTKILLECCVSTCSKEGAQRYEKDYSIQHTETLSIEERRRQIINKMLSKQTLTKEELVNLIKRNIDNSQFYISNFAEEYRFEIMLIDEKYKEKLYQTIFKARPANLLFEIRMVSYERRCGTFNSGGYVI